MGKINLNCLKKNLGILYTEIVESEEFKKFYTLYTKVVEFKKFYTFYYKRFYGKKPDLSGIYINFYISKIISELDENIELDEEFNDDEITNIEFFMAFIFDDTGTSISEIDTPLFKKLLKNKMSLCEIQKSEILREITNWLWQIENNACFYDYFEAGKKMTEKERNVYIQSVV